MASSGTPAKPMITDHRRDVVAEPVQVTVLGRHYVVWRDGAGDLAVGAPGKTATDVMPFGLHALADACTSPRSKAHCLPGR